MVKARGYRHSDASAYILFDIFWRSPFDFQLMDTMYNWAEERVSSGTDSLSAAAAATDLYLEATASSYTAEHCTCIPMQRQQRWP